MASVRDSLPVPETPSVVKLGKVCEEMGWRHYIRILRFRQELMVTVSIEHWVVRSSETKEKRHPHGGLYTGDSVPGAGPESNDYHTIATKTRLFPSFVIAGNISLFSSDLAVDTLILELFAQIGLSL